MPWTFNPFTGTLDYFRDQYEIVNHNANTILAISDLKKIHTMDVSGGLRTFTLPDIGADDTGLWVILVRLGTNELQIRASGTDTILNSSAGGYISSVDNLEAPDTHDYTFLRLLCITTNRWTADGFGIWSTY